MSKDFNPENYILLEQALLRLPQQLMRQNFKSSQKFIERDVNYISGAATEVLSSGMNGTRPEESVKQVDAMIGRLQGLKRKLEGLRDEENALMAKSKARLNHLQDLYKIKCVDDKEYERWNRVRLHRLLVDNLLRNGYSESAEALIEANESIRDLVDVDILMQCKKIEESLRNGSTAECLAWCQDNKSYLKKAKNGLEFDVRLQQYIEYVRHGRSLEAIAYSQKYLVPNADTNLDAILRSSALLVFPASDDDDNPYKDLYSQERWNQLADSFVATHHTLHGLSMPSLLQISLSAGLSALKTPSCKTGTHPISFVSNYNSSLCPICSPELNELSKPLPYAHHVRSSVEPDPVMLPNGRIYGRHTLLQFSEKAGLPEGKVRDPTTGDEWDESAIRRVFPS
ncbi:CTLH/CRA C-terminal to lish motif domain-containing protein [Lipomyces tetrasporus]|uniref:CTLH/CRA C-terminal to lish motif domain-containing protein n=1 Tax=Lipomyces tetrasporus TaxID=54092 RepID=A0AAD7QVD5_9ASCO|nr:CTLH/CRA C-terminal to lish motif domain-containing protein [Lipomyces tetrasporus]KAJ8102194.1 CTLH/CRA C-terminal to lish motif domain-containing protein [Lipomyces tetrasporus]